MVVTSASKGRLDIYFSMSLKLKGRTLEYFESVTS
jgi:hypothetical protein